MGIRDILRYIALHWIAYKFNPNTISLRCYHHAVGECSSHFFSNICVLLLLLLLFTLFDVHCIQRWQAAVVVVTCVVHALLIRYIILYIQSNHSNNNWKISKNHALTACSPLRPCTMLLAFSSNSMLLQLKWAFFPPSVMWLHFIQTGECSVFLWPFCASITIKCR